MDVEDFDFDSLVPQDRLNPAIWTETGRLRSDVRARLARIASDFFRDLEIPSNSLRDVRFTGSLANYNWSKYSDVDLHLVVDFDLVDENTDLVNNYFMARKNLWNNGHDIRVADADVEVYVEQAGEPHHSTGVYSIVQDRWITEPKYPSDAQVDRGPVTDKSRTLMRLIDDLVVSKLEAGENEEAIRNAEMLQDKLRKMRSCGLERGGEYSPENLTYKVLRRLGYLDRLRDSKDTAYDRMMTL